MVGENTEYCTYTPSSKAGASLTIVQRKTLFVPSVSSESESESEDMKPSQLSRNKKTVWDVIDGFAFRPGSQFDWTVSRGLTLTWVFPIVINYKFILLFIPFLFPPLFLRAIVNICRTLSLLRL